MVITGSLTISPRLCLLRDTATSMRSSSNSWRTWKGSAASVWSDTPGASCISPGNSWGISQCSLQSLRPTRKSCWALAGENSPAPNIAECRCSISGCSSVISACARGVGSMPLALRTNSGSSNISRSRFSAPLMAGWPRCSASAVRVTLASRYSTIKTVNRFRSIRLKSFSMIFFIMIINLNVGYPGSIVNITPINQPAQCARRE